MRVGSSLEVDPAVRVRRKRLCVLCWVPWWLWPVCSIRKRKRKKRMILCQPATAAALPPSGGGDEVGAIPGGEGCCHPTTWVGLRDHCWPLYSLFHMLSERYSFEMRYFVLELLLRLLLCSLIGFGGEIKSSPPTYVVFLSKHIHKVIDINCPDPDILEKMGKIQDFCQGEGLLSLFKYRESESSLTPKTCFAYSLDCLLTLLLSSILDDFGSYYMLPVSSRSRLKCPTWTSYRKI